MDVGGICIAVRRDERLHKPMRNIGKPTVNETELVIVPLSVN